MATNRRSKSFLTQDVHHAEFTSGQLVLGICGLLTVAMLCFVMGIMLEKWQSGRMDRDSGVASANPDEEPGFREALAAVETPNEDPPAPAKTDEPKTAAIIEAPPAEGKTTVVASKHLPAIESVKVSNKAPAKEETSSPTPTKSTAKPSNEHEPPKTTAAEVNADEPAEESVAAEPENEPEPETPAEPVTVAKADSAPAVVETPPAPAPSTSSGPRYTIQVAAFKDHNRAEQSKSRLDENTLLRSEFVKSADGQWTYLWVGDYATKEEAIRARDDLRKLAGFKDCFVKERK